MLIQLGKPKAGSCEGIRWAYMRNQESFAFTKPSNGSYELRSVDLSTGSACMR